jgi:hypothetical protein
METGIDREQHPEKEGETGLHLSLMAGWASLELALITDDCRAQLTVSAPIPIEDS